MASRVNKIEPTQQPVIDDVVSEFCAERASFITSINNCHPDNERDYWRWQGHAEARRKLSERLGLPVAWPADYPKGVDDA